MPETLSSERSYSLEEAAILSDDPSPSSTTSRGELSESGIFPVESSPRKVRIKTKQTEALQESMNQLDDLRTLSSGWNSYSAKRIEDEIVFRTLELLAELLDSETPAPIVVPRVQGNIQLEWHIGGIDIEVYINSPDEVNFFVEDVESGEGESLEKPLAGHERELKSWLQRISKSERVP